MFDVPYVVFGLVAFIGAVIALRSATQRESRAQKLFADAEAKLTDAEIKLEAALVETEACRAYVDEAKGVLNGTVVLGVLTQLACLKTRQVLRSKRSIDDQDRRQVMQQLRQVEQRLGDFLTKIPHESKSN